MYLGNANYAPSTSESQTSATLNVITSQFTPGGGGNERITLVFDSGNLPPALTLGNVTRKNSVTGATVDPTKMSLSLDDAAATANITFPALPEAHLADGRYRLTMPGTLFSFDFFRLNGDATQDATVSFADLVAVGQNYGKTGPQLSWSDGDFNGDNTIGFADLVALAQNYGRTLPAALPAPIPLASAAPAIIALAPAIIAPAPDPVSAAAIAPPTQSAVLVSKVSQPLIEKPKTSTNKNVNVSNIFRSVPTTPSATSKAKPIAQNKNVAMTPPPATAKVQANNKAPSLADASGDLFNRKAKILQ